MTNNNLQFIQGAKAKAPIANILLQQEQTLQCSSVGQAVRYSLIVESMGGEATIRGYRLFIKLPVGKTLQDVRQTMAEEVRATYEHSPRQSVLKACMMI